MVVAPGGPLPAAAPAAGILRASTIPAEPKPSEPRASRCGRPAPAQPVQRAKVATTSTWWVIGNRSSGCAEVSR
jgi:hypothetical protein